MSRHEWCQDVSRDSAVRAAEDAAAAERTPVPDHRDLPQAVAELRERVAGLESLVGKAAVAGVFDSVGVPPSPATRPGETEQPGRVQSQAEPWKWWNPLPSSWGALHPTPDALPEQVALLRASLTDILGRVVRLEAEMDAGQDEEAAPAAGGPEPRGWLTKNERAAVESARDYFAAPEHDDDECAFLAAALCGLLARSSPPRVKVPIVVTGFTHREHAEGWVNAIRAAGGEVEE